MIKTFASKETEKLFQREASRVLPTDIQRKARLKLEILDAVEKLDDLRVPPGNRAKPSLLDCAAVVRLVSDGDGAL